MKRTESPPLSFRNKCNLHFYIYEVRNIKNQTSIFHILQLAFVRKLKSDFAFKIKIYIRNFGRKI